MKIDFTEAGIDNWYALNDGVMGGLSQGKLINTDNGLLFTGSVSLENNGGFASFRGPWNSYDLTGYGEVVIKYRNEGMQFAFVMETDRRYYIPNYKVSLEKSEEWITATFTLKDFKQYRLGEPTGKIFTEDIKEDIIRMGFITDEKRKGEFSFEVASVEFR